MMAITKINKGYKILKIPKLPSYTTKRPPPPPLTHTFFFLPGFFFSFCFIILFSYKLPSIFHLSNKFNFLFLINFKISHFLLYHIFLKQRNMIFFLSFLDGNHLFKSFSFILLFNLIDQKKTHMTISPQNPELKSKF